ncbi:MAG: hypothetical protein LBF55_05110, partial [Prevotellaceae bacterium]|nr:hypothetical protein [Prevotellaceae bacterium]
DELIMIRRCTSPDDNVKLIYDKLGYKYYPFKMKKSVVHKSLFEKNILLNMWMLTPHKLQCGLSSFFLKRAEPFHRINSPHTPAQLLFCEPLLTIVFVANIFLLIWFPYGERGRIMRKTCPCAV